MKVVEFTEESAPLRLAVLVHTSSLLARLKCQSEAATNTNFVNTVVRPEQDCAGTLISTLL